MKLNRKYTCLIQESGSKICQIYSLTHAKNDKLRMGCWPMTSDQILCIFCSLHIINFFIYPFQVKYKRCPVQPSLGSVCPVSTARYIADAPAFASLQDRILSWAAVVQWTAKLASPGTKLPLLCFKELQYVQGSEPGMGRKLGEGAFGKVFLAWCALRGKYVAVKMYKRYGQASCGRIRKIFEEALFYHEVRDTDAAPQLIGMCAFDRQDALNQDFYPLGIVMEFIGDTATLNPTDLVEICDAIYKPQCKPELVLSKRQCVSLLIDIIKKLRSLHKMNVIVNDIKLDNILIQRSGNHFTPYFIDFSNAKLGAKRNLRVDLNGRTVDKYLEDHRQIAPEWPLQGRVHRPSDVFAMGLLFLQMGNVWDLPHLIQLGTRCRTYQPERRPTLYQLFGELVNMFKSLKHGTQFVSNLTDVSYNYGY